MPPQTGKAPDGQYRVLSGVMAFSKSFFLGRTKRRRNSIEQIERDIANGKDRLWLRQETTQVIQKDGSKDMRIEELAVRHLEWVKITDLKGRSKIDKCLRSGFPEIRCEVMVFRNSA